jgi:hypothetical protein
VGAAAKSTFFSLCSVIVRLPAAMSAVPFETLSNSSSRSRESAQSSAGAFQLLRVFLVQVPLESAHQVGSQAAP